MHLPDRMIPIEDVELLVVLRSPQGEPSRIIPVRAATRTRRPYRNATLNVTPREKGDGEADGSGGVSSGMSPFYPD